jgi:hypothetical protein
MFLGCVIASKFKHINNHASKRKFGRNLDKENYSESMCVFVRALLSM